MRLKHKQGANYSFSNVSVHYDGKIAHLAVNENGIVEVNNKVQAEQLMDQHGAFQLIDDEELPDYVLQDMNVNEVKEYVRDMEDLNRLKELRQLESEHKGRTTALNKIDSRINELNQSSKDDVKPENNKQDVEEEDEVSEEDEKESSKADDAEQ